MSYLYVRVCVVLAGTVASFLFMFTVVTNLNDPSSSFLLPPRYCGLGSGSIPLRAILNQKQYDKRRPLMSLVIHYGIGDVPGCIRLRNYVYCVGWSVRSLCVARSVIVVTRYSTYVIV